MSLLVASGPTEGSSAGLPSKQTSFFFFTFFGPMVGRRRWGVRVESSPEPAAGCCSVVARSEVGRSRLGGGGGVGMGRERWSGEGEVEVERRR